jgi:hypothetical protein
LRGLFQPERNHLIALQRAWPVQNVPTPNTKSRHPNVDDAFIKQRIASPKPHAIVHPEVCTLTGSAAAFELHWSGLMIEAWSRADEPGKHETFGVVRSVAWDDPGNRSD